jgi:AcrR family transcriptional regulator
VAREQFAREGYAESATEEIVRRAGVTRGALYHHFGSKQGLFVAVLEDVLRELAARVEAAAAAEGDLWVQLRVGCHAFLRAAIDPRVQRIALIDAPAVLGWETWRELDGAHSQRLLQSAMEALKASGQLSVASPAAATAVLSGAMNEAALWIARSDSPEAALAEAIDTLDRLLEGLRAERR